MACMMDRRTASRLLGPIAILVAGCSSILGADFGDVHPGEPAPDASLHADANGACIALGQACEPSTQCCGAAILPLAPGEVRDVRPDRRVVRDGRRLLRGLHVRRGERDVPADGRVRAGRHHVRQLGLVLLRRVQRARVEVRRVRHDGQRMRDGRRLLHGPGLHVRPSKGHVPDEPAVHRQRRHVHGVVAVLRRRRRGPRVQPVRRLQVRRLRRAREPVQRQRRLLQRRDVQLHEWQRDGRVRDVRHERRLVRLLRRLLPGALLRLRARRRRRPEVVHVDPAVQEARRDELHDVHRLLRGRGRRRLLPEPFRRHGLPLNAVGCCIEAQLQQQTLAIKCYANADCCSDSCNTSTGRCN